MRLSQVHALCFEGYFNVLKQRARTCERHIETNTFKQTLVSTNLQTKIYLEKPQKAPNDYIQHSCLEVNNK